MSDTTGQTPAMPDQPDGIDTESHDLPDPAKAAERIRAYVSEFGDGLYDEVNGKPLYGRDLEAVTRAVAGRTIVELPEPDSVENGEATWTAPGSKRRVNLTAYVEQDGQPYVEDEYDATRADDTDRYALAKLAAARWACRLASESSGDSPQESLAARIARFGSSGYIKIGSPEGPQIVEDTRPRCPAEGPTDMHDGPHVCVRHAGHSEPPEDEHLCGCGADWSGESSGDGESRG